MLPQLGAKNSRVYADVTNGNGGAGITVASSGNQIFNNTSVGNLGGDLEDLNAGCGTNFYFWSNNIFFFCGPLHVSVSCARIDD